MNRRAMPAAASLTATAVLLLTACGSGGGDDSSSDKIKGAGQGGNSSSSPSASAPASSGGADRPGITLPRSFQANFEGWSNSDPKLQTILNDGGEELKSKYAAIIESDPDSDAVAFYNSEATLTSARKWIKQFVDDDDSLIGKVTATPDEPDSVIQYRARLDKTSQGVWKTVALTTVPGACS